MNTIGQLIDIYAVK